jgi:hypothetical protein
MLQLQSSEFSHELIGSCAVFLTASDGNKKYPRKEAHNGPPGGHFRAEEASPENMGKLIGAPQHR